MFQDLGSSQVLIIELGVAAALALHGIARPSGLISHARDPCPAAAATNRAASKDNPKAQQSRLGFRIDGPADNKFG